MNQECMILFHLSTGDIFTSYPIIMYYLDKFTKIHIFSLYRNKYTTKQLFEKYDKIIIYNLDESYNRHFVTEEISSKYYNSNIKIISLGNHNNATFNLDSGINFWKIFYKQANLDYNIRYNYININRNENNERLLYNKVIENYGKNYIFTHDHRSYTYKHYDIRRNVYVNNVNDIPVFHPNFNYYDNDLNHKYYNLWFDFISNNLLDYCMILENASEIHITDSCFSCLLCYLNLEKVKVKKIYTALDLIDYHKCFETWEIIKA
jgi:hypothetical protein